MKQTFINIFIMIVVVSTVLFFLLIFGELANRVNRVQRQVDVLHEIVSVGTR